MPCNRAHGEQGHHDAWTADPVTVQPYASHACLRLNVAEGKVQSCTLAGHRASQRKNGRKEARRMTNEALQGQATARLDSDMLPAEAHMRRARCC